MDKTRYPDHDIYPEREGFEEEKQNTGGTSRFSSPPYIPSAPAQNPIPAPPRSPSPMTPDWDLDPPSSPEETRRVTRSQTRGGGRPDQLYPLRELPMGGPQPGMGFVSMPLSSGDIRDFKKEMGNLLEDPLGVAEKLDQFLGPSLYTWEELQSILSILFTAEEREMIRRAGMQIWDQQHQQGPAADIKWPTQRPDWDNQNAEHRTHMSDLRTIIVQGIRESVPRGQNINKAFMEQQKKDETPTEWLERLRKNLQLYSGVDPSTPVGQALLKTQFVAKAFPDIRRKLEKLDDWQDRGLDELLREAQKVYVRREEETHWWQAKILVAAVREGQRGIQAQPPRSYNRPKRKPPHQEGQPREVVTRDLRQVECFYCQKKGHLKRNCRKRMQDEQMFQED
uniref:CCHC-type domain-containing protein n=1 Tax=Apteryx owenii TaxID=8824 RepID=A0A8B9SE57_APTOW